MLDAETPSRRLEMELAVCNTETRARLIGSAHHDGKIDRAVHERMTRKMVSWSAATTALLIIAALLLGSAAHASQSVSSADTVTSTQKEAVWHAIFSSSLTILGLVIVLIVAYAVTVTVLRRGAKRSDDD